MSAMSNSAPPTGTPTLHDAPPARPTPLPHFHRLDPLKAKSELMAAAAAGDVGAVARLIRVGACVNSQDAVRHSSCWGRPLLLGQWGAP